MNFFLRTITALTLVSTLSFCKKDSKTEATPDPTPTPGSETKTGGLSLFFENKVDSLGLAFNKDYVNTNGDTFSVSKFNYFITNIVLTKSDGSTFAESESYHLIKHSDQNTYWINLKNVPVGSYKSVKFTVGVDSARNVSGAQTGDLSMTTAADMFWSWNTGYIFFKLEGKARRSADPGKRIEYHIGGYGGANKAQRTISFTITEPAEVSTSISPKVHFFADINKVFDAKTKIDFSKSGYYTVLNPGAYSLEIADNYAQMFRYGHTHND